MVAARGLFRTLSILWRAGRAFARLAFAVTLLTAALASPDAFAQGRVALVIGNNRYANLPADKQLSKAVNDARAVGAALEKIGFKVIRGENLDRQSMVDRIFAFTQQIKQDDIAVLFYAGHGVAISGGNYLLPSDVRPAAPGEESRVRNMAIGEADIVADIQDKKARVAVLLLDACRDNPFRQPGLLRSAGESAGLTRGREGEGVFAIYSAGFGQSALDSLGPNDRSENSVFTRILVPALGRTDTHLAEIVFDMREDVAKLAATINHQQFPAYYDQTRGGRVYLAPRGPSPTPSVASRPAVPAPPVIRPPEPAIVAADEILWDAIKDYDFPAVFEDFLRRHPTSSRARNAREKIESLKTKQAAVQPSGSPAPASVPRTQQPASPPIAQPPSTPANDPRPKQPRLRAPIDDLQKNARAFPVLGIEAVLLNQELIKTYGIQGVSSGLLVVRASPGPNGLFEPGEVIVEIGDWSSGSAISIDAAISRSWAQRSFVPLLVADSTGSKRYVRFTGVLRQQPPRPQGLSSLGIEAIPFSQDVAKTYGIQGVSGGLVVTQISPELEGSLRLGEVIVEAGDWSESGLVSLDSAIETSIAQRSFVAVLVADKTGAKRYERLRRIR